MMEKDKWFNLIVDLHNWMCGNCLCESECYFQILGNTIHVSVVEEQYAARVSNLQMYDSIRLEPNSALKAGLHVSKHHVLVLRATLKVSAENRRLFPCDIL